MNEKLIHSPIKSYGGKGNFLKQILQYAPANYSSFIEPFAGSAVVALNIKQEKCSIIINDLNKNIYSFFKVLSDPILFPKFKEKIDLILYHETLFRESLEELKDPDLNIVDRCYHFFIANRMSYSGNMGSFGINPCSRRGMSKSCSDLLSTIDRLPSLHQQLQQFVITGRNGIKLIEQYSNPDYFIYADPPYHHSTRTSTRYPVDMDDKQHEELVEAMINCKSSILLSGYKNELYEKRLVDENKWTRIDIEVHTVTGGNKPKDKIESLYKNF
jgi:DNA adenine methylase